ncbi:MAG: hypothetical protein HPY85_14800 [Anaerolineae bacterium]|jgi:hypothetical protein|nr:hypothetical protein [Anaerolineae bacterium]
MVWNGSQPEMRPYRIEIEQQLSPTFLAVLGDVEERIEQEQVFLEGSFRDQSELIGLIQKLFSLHINIVSVVPLDRVS